MAYINVAEWSPDQVTDWLKGLDNSMYKYVNSFANNEIKGQTLLNIRPYELNELGITSIGHQEIVLEAVEQLRNFNYDLEKENLQFLALHVATTAKNLHHQLSHYPDKSKVETQILNDITRAIGTIKPLVGWLDRSPFQGQLQFNEIRKQILRLGIEMATSAQRDRFVENPVDQIRLTAEKLSKLADYIIQDISDPIILQPATLNLVTLKKRESELGFNIVPNYHGIHVITDIKYNSPAHISGKIEEGDEIIQINYQTVVGWHYKRVLQQLQESPPDVLLTLKKRPRHTKIYGQIYMKPYRLPSKKRALPYRFGDNLPSPRIELLPSQNFPVLLPLSEKGNLSDSDSSSSDSMMIPVEPTKNNEKDLRLYLPKPRAVLQRRNTICGDQASGFRGNITIWHEMNIRRNIEGNNLRDKSVSFGFGLEISLDKRPITCIGINLLGNALKGSLPDMAATDKENEKQSLPKTSANDVNDNTISQCGEVSNISDNNKYENDGKARAVKFNTSQDIIEKLIESNGAEYSVPIQPIKLDQKSSQCPDVGLTEAINVALIGLTIKGTHQDKPPEIGPRKEFLKKVAPKPPPRPSKAAELVQRKFDLLRLEKQPTNNADERSAPLCEYKFNHSKEADGKETIATDTQTSPIIHGSRNDENLKSTQSPQTPTRTVFAKSNKLEENSEESELLTPNRAKTLTLKKKNSMLAKRRKICLKSLEFSDIQGHLFRRMKDKHGATYWLKLYFVLVETALYGFRNKKSSKAHCLIFLPGFTISLATEVHSKQFAYKVYHQKKTFYFAAESQQALDQWMDYIKRATLKGNAANIDPMLVENRDLYSETDSSDGESEQTNDDLSSSFKKAVHGKSSKKRGSIDEISPNITQSKSEKYHLGFGSLKKFTNLHNLPFSSNKSDKEREERKKVQSDIPVPTPQFRSYRKIHGNAGMQLGSNTLVDYNMMAHRLQQSNVHTKVPSISSPVIIDQSISKINESANEIEPKSNTPVPICSTAAQHDITTVSAHNIQKTPTSPSDTNLKSTPQIKNYEHPAVSRPTSKLSKSKASPFNYMHASNPNLVEFTFQTSKNLDVGLPKVNISNTFDQHQNLQGFITLKDLMLQHEEDEAHNLYNNRVNLGVEKPSDRHTKHKHRRPNNEVNFEINRAIEDINTPQSVQKSCVNKIQRRSLPKTPDYAQSFKADDTEIIMARSKEGQKLRDFGYEFISGDDINNENHKSISNNSNGINSNIMNTLLIQKISKPAVGVKPNERFILPTKRKGLNWIQGLTLDNKRNDDEKIISKGSFKLVKQKPSEIVDSNRKYDISNSVFQATHTHANNKTDPVKSFPSDDRKGSIPTSITITSTTTTTNSAPYLSKLAFPTKTMREKRLLGSPRLHRAASSIFGRRNVESPSSIEYGSTLDHHDKSGQNANSVYHHQTLNKIQDSSHELGAISGVSMNCISPVSALIANSSDQNIEYPPVFVPETYSLRDANSNH